MFEALWVFLFSVAFAVTHIGLEVGPVKSKITEKIGAAGFKGVYILISLVTLGGAFYLLRGNFDKGWIIWKLGIPGKLLGVVVLLLAMPLIVFGMMQPSPTGMVQLSYEPKGIQFVTRHPVNMGIALLGLSHMLMNQRLAPIAFFASLFVTGFFGAYHQDMRKKKDLGEKFAAFAAKTSVMPLGALATGKASFNELKKLPLPGMIVCAVLFVVIVVFHRKLFGISPF